MKAKNVLVGRLGRWVLLAWGLAGAGRGWSQAPVITATLPRANAIAAPRNGLFAVTFNQPLNAGSAGALKVFSSQRGGLRTHTTPATANGNALSFAPAAYPFMPGETVQYTVTTAATGSNGGPLAQPQVGQFTTAVGGTGSGNFVSGNTVAVGPSPNNMTVGDVDGDGDLDVLTANTSSPGSVSIRFNDGRGNFSGTQEVAVGDAPAGIAVADVDGDGDLDFATANLNSGFVSVRLNNGTGFFTSGSDPATNTGSASVALADVDGDGDVDLLAANVNAYTVSVRLNNGSGIFSGGSNVAVASQCNSVAVGDVDNDGDLDLLTANYGNSTNNTVSVRLNNGTGTFTGSQDVTVGVGPYRLVLGDVDNDSDLDFLVTNNGTNAIPGNTVSVRFNDGTGTFAGILDVPVAASPFGVAVGDIDHDGDLDLVATNPNSQSVSIRRNDGRGNFSGTQSVSVGSFPDGLVLGDADGDGDLDIFTADVAGSAVISLNGGTGLATVASVVAPAAFTLYPNPATGMTTLTAVAPYAVVQAFDPLGRLVAAATADATGTAVLALPASLPPGVYIVRGGGLARRLAVE